jgi:hypothetical protein
MDRIDTKDDWWKLVDTQWSKLLSIFYMYLPMDGQSHICPETGKVVLNPKLEPLGVEIERLKANRESHLARYFYAAWDSAPDSSSIHSIPGWSALCILLSEEPVLYE